MMKQRFSLRKLNIIPGIDQFRRLLLFIISFVPVPKKCQFVCVCNERNRQKDITALALALDGDATKKDGRLLFFAPSPQKNETKQ